MSRAAAKGKALAGPPAPATGPVTVFTDTALSPEMAVAYRQHQLGAAPVQDTLLLPALSKLEDFLPTIQVIALLKKDGKMPGMPSTGHPLYGATQGFIKSGLIEDTGKAKAGLQDLLKKDPRLEFIFKVSEGHYAAVVFAKGGVAYIDPTGAPCPSDKIQLASQKKGDPPQEVAFSLALPGFWGMHCGFTEEQAQKRGGDVHLSQGVTLNDGKKAYSLDGVLTSFGVLHTNIAAKEDAFKKAKKLDRKSLVAAINNQAIPGKPGEKFNLKYCSESKDKQEWQAWRQRAGDIKDMRGTLFANAEAKQVQRRATVDGGGDDPGLPKWAEVTLERQVTYNASKKLNVIESEDSDGIKNTIEEKADSYVMTSSEGRATYYQRFLSLASDLRTSLVVDAELGVFKLPVVINSVNPPAQEATCMKAFEAIFGEGNVEIKAAAPIVDDAVEMHYPGPPV